MSLTAWTSPLSQSAKISRPFSPRSHWRAQNVAPVGAIVEAKNSSGRIRGAGPSRFVPPGAASEQSSWGPHA